MVLESELNRLLPNYREIHLREVHSEKGGLRIKAEVPPSVTCPELLHTSPADITLSVMQAAYVLAGSTLSGLPYNYQNRALFLRHKARYVDQSVAALDVYGRIRSTHSGVFGSLSIEIDQQDVLEERLMCGILQEEPVSVIEDLAPKGLRISKDQIEETLNIYHGEVQSEVISVGFDPETQAYEAAIYFPPYEEIANLGHISARQMIEALMKSAYCGASDMAFRGKLPLTYQEFLDQRLLFRTREHNLGYRKLLASGSQSLVRFQLSFESGDCIVRFTHRPKALKEEESFATGSMTFYLPDTTKN